MYLPTKKSRRPSARVALTAVAWLIAASPLFAQGLPLLKTPAAIYELKEDGTGWSKTCSFSEYMRLGSLRLSPDATRMCFDGVKPGEPWSAAQLLSCRLDGSDFKNHGTGAMPNFSPDRKRISYCSYSGGVRMLDVVNETDTAIAERGWGVQWSPVSSQIAYVVGGAVMIRDMDTGDERPLFPQGTSPYQSVSFNMAWSHDGKQLALQGTRADGGREIAVVDAQGPEFGFTVVTPMTSLSNFLTFHPSGRKVAFQSFATPSKCSQIFSVDVGAGKKPERIPGQPEDFDNVCAAWSEGGRKMRVVSWQR